MSASVTLHSGPAGGFTRTGQAMTSCRFQPNHSFTVTLHGEPVVLRPVRATPGLFCDVWYILLFFGSSVSPICVSYWCRLILLRRDSSSSSNCLMNLLYYYHFGFFTNMSLREYKIICIMSLHCIRDSITRDFDYIR